MVAGSSSAADLETGLRGLLFSDIFHLFCISFPSLFMLLVVANKEMALICMSPCKRRTLNCQLREHPGVFGSTGVWFNRFNSTL